MTNSTRTVAVPLLLYFAGCQCGVPLHRPPDGASEDDAGVISITDAGEPDAGKPDAGGDAGEIDGGAWCWGPLDDAGCPPEQPHFIGFVVCDDACSVTEMTKLCTYPAARCTCELGDGFNWQCEDARCPQTPLTLGAACSIPELVCANHFESPGIVCDADAGWLQCEYARQDNSGGRAHCPYDSTPVVGAPCCVVNWGGIRSALEDCEYYVDADGGARQKPVFSGGSPPDASWQVYECVRRRWARIY